MGLTSSFEELKNIQKSGKLSGSWLISGTKGVGKRTLIRQFSAHLLECDDVSFHPDLKWVECDYTEKDKKEIIKTLKEGQLVTDEMQKSFKRKSEITVEDIRAGINFLSLTSSGDKWRILVIDSADDMNENAANALLKLLEEPPQRSLIFLVSHNKGKLISTIRSRCREMVVKPLSKKEMEKYILDTFEPQENINELIELSNGSIGKIKDLIENGNYEIYQEMLSLMGPRKNETAAIYAFCDRFSGEMEDVFLLKDFILFYLISLAKKASNPRPFLDLWEEVNTGFKDMENLYLDKKNMFAHFFFKIGALS